MTIVETLDTLTNQIELIFRKWNLLNPKCGVSTSKEREAIKKVLSLCQDLYNQVELSLELLGVKMSWGDPTFNEQMTDLQFYTKLVTDLMGNYTGNLISYKVKVIEYTIGGCEFEFTQVSKGFGGIKSLIQLLTNAVGCTMTNSTFAENIKSAYSTFQMTAGAIERLKSRLNWQVMYPDSLSKDSIRLRELMQKHGFDEVWSEFQAGLDNYRQNHLLDSTNRFANATNLLIAAIARSYGFESGQIGAQTLFLEKLGFIHDRTREMISQFWGYLSKFRKGNDPTRTEAMFLLDLAFSIFGFLLPHIDEYVTEQDMIVEANKATKRVIKMRKEEEARRIVKSDGKSKASQ